MRWPPRWSFLLLLLSTLCLGTGATTAGSPDPVASPVAPVTPVASPRSQVASSAVDCSNLAASMSETVGEGGALEATATSGVEGIDPDDLLDPLLRSLGLERTDVCGVTLRTADPARVGMLLRFRGGGTDLAKALAVALADRLRSYGQVVREDALQVGGVLVTRLLVGPTTSATPLLVVAATTDSVLLADSPELAEALLAALPHASPTPPLGVPMSPTPRAMVKVSTPEP